MTRLGRGGSSGVARDPGTAQASISSRRGTKASGMWLSRSVIARCVVPWRGLRSALGKDAGVMVISDPS